MKQTIIILVAVMLCLPYFTNAQKPMLGCIDKQIRQQSEDIKQHYIKQGFVPYKDAMLNMESQIPAPVIARLQSGQLYIIIFLGPIAIQKMNFEMYDGNDNLREQRFMYANRKQPNYIIVTFSPEKTDDYLFMLRQKLKNKDICGSFTILKFDKASNAVQSIVPYTE